MKLKNKLLFIIFVLVLLVPNVVALSGYSYHSNSTTTSGTGKIILSNANGTASDTTIYGNGFMNVNFTDVAITNNDTEIPFCIEDNATGVTWVKTTGTQLTVWFGNTSDTVSNSNCALATSLYDDFNDGSKNTSRWTEGSYTESGGVMTGTIGSVATFGTGYSLRIKSKHPSANTSSQYLVSWADAIAMGKWISYRSYGDTGKWAKEKYPTAVTTQTSRTTDSDYHIFEIGKISTTGYFYMDDLYDDGTLTGTDALANKVVSYSAGTVWDWVMVLPYPFTTYSTFTQPDFPFPEITSWSNTVTDTNATTIDVNQSVNVTFNITTDIPITSCNWVGATAINCSGTSSYAYKNFTDLGIYTVSVNASDANGTSSTITWDVNVASPLVKFTNGMVDVSNTSGGWVYQGSTFENTKYRIRTVNNARTSDTYVYKNLPDPIPGDFTHHFTATFDPATATGIRTIWMLGDSVDDVYGGYVSSTYNHGLILNYTDDGSTMTARLYERDGTTSTIHWTQQVGGSGKDGSTLRYKALYYTISRISNQLNVSIFSDISRTQLLYSSGNKTLNSIQSYKYLFLANSYNDGSAGVVNGFSGELYMDTEPKHIFEVLTERRPFNHEDNESFELGFPSGSETWTGSGNVSTNWSSDGTSSLYLVDTNNSYGDGAYFTPSVTTLGGGVIEADINITSLANGEFTELLSMWDNGNGGVVAYATNVSGTIYLRIGHNDSSFEASPNNGAQISLGTSYKIMITDYSQGDSGQQRAVTLYVDNTYADHAIHSDQFFFDRIGVGYFSNYKGGTRYIDNVRYRNGNSYFPAIARGGVDNSTVIYLSGVGDTHGKPAYLDIFYSEDDGSNFTYAATINASGKQMNGFPRWNPTTGLYYIFANEYYNNGSANPHHEIYTYNQSSKTVTAIRDFDDEPTPRFWVHPSRYIDSNGDLLVGMSYFVDPWNAATTTVWSGRYNFTTNNITHRYQFSSYNEMCAGGTTPSEPMMWHNNTGTLFGMIRFDGYAGSCMVGDQRFRYKTSTDDGTSTWTSNFLINPGIDWEMRPALSSGFVFRNYTWWQGRDGFIEENLASGRTISRVHVPSTLWRADLEPDANGLLPFSAEIYWPALDESGNGDIDAKFNEVGTLKIDYVGDIYASAVYMRLDTGELAMSQFSSWANNQTSNNTLYLTVTGSPQSILFNATADDDLSGECTWEGATEVSCSGATTSATQLFDSDGTYYVNLSSTYSNNSISWQVTVDVTPPSGVTNVSMETGNFFINNTWTQPIDADLNHTWFRYVNETLIENVSAGIEHLNLTWSPHYEQNISSQTVDVYGNINQTKVWFNVTIPNNAPVLTAIGSPQTVIYGNYLNFTISATDADSDAIIYGTNASNGTIFPDVVSVSENLRESNDSQVDTTEDNVFIKEILFNQTYNGTINVKYQLWSNGVNDARASIRELDGVTELDDGLSCATNSAIFQQCSINVVLDNASGFRMYAYGATAHFRYLRAYYDYNERYFSWIPTESDIGTYIWNFNATDNYGGNGNETITVTVYGYAPNITQYWNNINGYNQSTININASESIIFNTTANQTLTSVRYRVQLVGDGGYVTEQNTSDTLFTRSFPSFGTWDIEQTGYNSNGTTQSIVVRVNVDYNKTGLLNVYYESGVSPTQETNSTYYSKASSGTYSPGSIIQTTNNITGEIKNHFESNSTTEEGVYIQNHKNNVLIYLSSTFYSTSTNMIARDIQSYITLNNTDTISASFNTNGADIANVQNNYLMYSYYVPNITDYCNDFNGCNQTAITLIEPTTINFNISVDKTISSVNWSINGVEQQNTSSLSFIKLINAAGNHNVTAIAYAVDESSSIIYTNITITEPEQFLWI